MEALRVEGERGRVGEGEILWSPTRPLTPSPTPGPESPHAWFSRKGLHQLPGGQSRDGMPPARGNLGQRRQSKAPRRETGMGEHRVGRIADG